jgi:hypothetical protein
MSPVAASLSRSHHPRVRQLWAGSPSCRPSTRNRWSAGGVVPTVVLAAAAGQVGALSIAVSVPIPCPARADTEGRGTRPRRPAVGTHHESTTAGGRLAGTGRTDERHPLGTRLAPRTVCRRRRGPSTGTARVNRPHSPTRYASNWSTGTATGTRRLLAPPPGERREGEHQRAVRTGRDCAR